MKKKWKYNKQNTIIIILLILLISINGVNIFKKHDITNKFSKVLGININKNLLDENGEKINIKEIIDANTVLVFATNPVWPSCINQLVELNDNLKLFEPSNTKIYIISEQSTINNLNVKKQFNINISIISDPYSDIKNYLDIEKSQGYVVINSDKKITQEDFNFQYINTLIDYFKSDDK